jgi:SPP1 family holin
MDKASITRVVALVIVLVNAVLNIAGFETIPTEFGDDLSAVLLTVVSLWTAWKNNYISRKGRAQKEALEQRGLK